LIGERVAIVVKFSLYGKPETDKRIMGKVDEARRSPLMLQRRKEFHRAEAIGRSSL
jgi:hypothetical protein